MVLLIANCLLPTSSFAQNTTVTFSQADRDRLIRMEVILEQHDKRFEDVNKRFEDINKRFEELREDMNTRFEQIHAYLGWMIALFASITTATIGFAIWDRRNMIRPFETKVKEIESTIELKSTRTEQILSSLRELAKTDSKIAEALKTYHLL